jgi:hypothetical protein
MAFFGHQGRAWGVRRIALGALVALVCGLVAGQWPSVAAAKTGSETATFEYDALNRLVRSTLTDADPLGTNPVNAVTFATPNLVLTNVMLSGWNCSATTVGDAWGCYGGMQMPGQALTPSLTVSGAPSMVNLCASTALFVTEANTTCQDVAVSSTPAPTPTGTTPTPTPTPTTTGQIPKTTERTPAEKEKEARKKPCACMKLSVRLDPTLFSKRHLPADKQNFGVGFKWRMTCTQGKGGCKGELYFKPPEILAGSLPNIPGLKLNIKRKTIVCRAKCKTSTTGTFEIKMTSPGQLNKLFGRTLAYSIITTCGKTKTTLAVRVFVDSTGRLHMR